MIQVLNLDDPVVSAIVGTIACDEHNMTQGHLPAQVVIVDGCASEAAH